MKQAKCIQRASCYWCQAPSETIFVDFPIEGLMMGLHKICCARTEAVGMQTYDVTCLFYRRLSSKNATSTVTSQTWRLTPLVSFLFCMSNVVDQGVQQIWYALHSMYCLPCAAVRGPHQLCAHHLCICFQVLLSGISDPLHYHAQEL